MKCVGKMMSCLTGTLQFGLLQLF